MKILSKFLTFNLIKDGNQGDAGPIIYPMGEWQPNEKYVGDSNSRPYVIYKDEHYFMAKEGTFSGTNTNPQTEAVKPNGIWKRMTKFKAIFTEILFANFAKLGSAVFYGDYILSQYGLDTKTGGESSNYKNFPTGTFKPHFLVDLKKGEVSMNKLKAKGSYINNFEEFTYDTPLVNGCVDLEKTLNWYGNGYLGKDLTITLPTDKKFSGAMVNIYVPAGTRSNTGITLKIQNEQGFLNLSESESKTIKTLKLYNGIVSLMGVPSVHSSSGGTEWTVTNYPDWIEKY